MFRRLLTLVAFLAALPLSAPAQEQVTGPTPVPTATPNFMQYNDAAMHFVAPASFVPIGQRQVQPKELGEDPMTVAGWIFPDKQRPRTLAIEQEAFEGDVTGFDQVFEQQLRSQFNAFFHAKERMSLKNGMPAQFMTATWGDGFEAKKAYMVIWADGVRGVGLLLTTQIGDIDDKTAKAYLSDCTAVQYPKYRDY